jgi:Asp-tRNA(Asn)/Glu-tRNA(Gln) amidotransferase A subunit family amidase
MKMHLCTNNWRRWRCINRKNYLWASLQWMISMVCDKLKTLEFANVVSNGSSAGSASATVAGLVPLPLV